MEPISTRTCNLRSPRILNQIGAAALLLWSAAGFQTVQAQTRVVVEPDDFPAFIGALNIAIEENGGDVVYVLKNGATYFLDGALEYDHPLHLEAETYPSDNPPIIRPGSNLTGGSSQISAYRNDVTAIGVFFYGRDDLGSEKGNQRTSAEGAKMLYQHCYMATQNNYFFRLDAIDINLRVEDCQFANGGRHTSPNNQRFIDFRGNDQDSIVVVNTSIYQTYHHMIRDGGGGVNYLEFDHVTIVNQGNASMFNLHIAKEAIIKNSLFVNASADGQWESAEVAGQDGVFYTGERYYTDGGFISITSYDGLIDPSVATDADRNIVIKNNNFGVATPEIHAYWDEISTDADGDGSNRIPYGTDPQWLLDNPTVTPDDAAWATRDTIPLVRVARSPFDSTLTAWMDPANNATWMTAERNIYEAVELTDAPEMERFASYLRAFYFGEDLDNHQDRWNDIGADPNTRFFHPGPGTPVATTGGTASWFRNLSYNTDSDSYMHAEDGYPVGSLVYFPDLREKWGNGEVITSAEATVENPESFRVVGNYPNPFNPSTTIVFELGGPSDVTLEIFNILGQQVESLRLGALTGGSHEVSFDAANLTSGTYMVRMHSAAGVNIHFMTLLK